MAGRHPDTETIDVAWSVSAEDIRQFRHDGRLTRVRHKPVDGLFHPPFARFGKVRVDGGGGWALMAEQHLDEAQVHPVFQEMGGI